MTRIPLNLPLCRLLKNPLFHLQPKWRRLLSQSFNHDNRTRPDPTVKRPNKKCDPFGQGGKPLTIAEIPTLSSTISTEWKVEYADDENDSNPVDIDTPTMNPQNEHKGDNKKQQLPIALIREYIHPDFYSGARFLNKIAAVAQMNGHFPTLKLDRVIVKNNKNWQVRSTCRCHTIVLGGLSKNDFYLAMVRNVLNF